MRDGVRARVVRLAASAGVGAHRWSPPALLGVLCAGAFAPLLTAGVGGAALVSAGIGAIASVGGNVLTDVVKAGVERLGGEDGGLSPQELEVELERQIRDALEAGGEDADRLRSEIAVVLEKVGAVGAALDAAVQTGDGTLLAELAAGFTETGHRFTEFGFLLGDLQAELRLVRDGVDEQSGRLRLAIDLLYRQATDTRVLLEQVSQTRLLVSRTEGALGTEDAWGEECPYQGLVPFGEADSRVFYGRERVTAQLTSLLSQRLTAPGLVMVTGASGAGKSSLLRAGLLPAIGRGELSDAAREWPRHVIEEPTRSPLARFAGLLAPMAALQASAVLDSLTNAPEQAHLLVRQAVDTDAQRRGLSASDAGAARLILVVDQFEGIFHPSDVPDQIDERDAFITALHAVATTPCGLGDAPAAVVVIAVRGDFVDRCAAHPALADALQGSGFVVGPMNEPDLRLTITAPASAAGMELEAGVVEAILSELRTPTGRYETGVLPLVSQTMMTVWEHREGHQLTLRGYERTGGVTRAVATGAETAYTSLSKPARDLARRIFLQLAGVAQTGRLTRRTAARAGLYAQGEQVDQILDTFAQRRLIVIDADTVQIGHEVLLEAWPRLRTWLETDLTGHALHGQLRDDAEEWARNDRQPSYLYRGERLAAVQQTRTRWDADLDRYPPLAETQAAFLKASTAAETRSTRLRRSIITTLAGLLAIAVLAAGLASRAQQRRRPSTRYCHLRPAEHPKRNPGQRRPHRGQTGEPRRMAAQPLRPSPLRHACRRDAPYSHHRHRLRPVGDVQSRR